jgi:hypothetical protein
MAATAKTLIITAFIGVSALTGGCADATTGPRSWPSPPTSALTSAPPTSTAKPPWQMTPEQYQLCNRLTWPRPIPAATGLILASEHQDPQPLTCLDGTRLIGPNGQPFVLDPDHTYRITGLSPPAGTLVGRDDPVTVHLARVDPQEPSVFRPCDWVSAADAARLLGGSPVTMTSLPHDKAGSTDIECDYGVVGGTGIGSQLRSTAAHVVDAATEFDFVTSTAEDSPSTASSPVNGLGIKAACTTLRKATHVNDVQYALYVLLPDDRIYAVHGDLGASCDMLTQFAQAAVPHIT